MALGWKVFIPIALAYIMLIAVGLWVIEGPLGMSSPVSRGFALFGLNLPVLGLVFWVLDRGHVIGGAFSRAPVPAVKPARAA